MRTDTTVIAAVMLRKGDADCMICGSVGNYQRHLAQIEALIGTQKGIHSLAALSVLILPVGTFFICDSHVIEEPDVSELTEMTVMAAQQVRAFGIEPKVALVSRSNFGSQPTSRSERMRAAIQRLHDLHPDLEVDGEMHADTALSQDLRDAVYPGSHLTGQANLFIMPSSDAAHIAYGLLKKLGGGVSVGPILIGACMPAHIVTDSVTVRGLLNMAALTVSQAQEPNFEANVTSRSIAEIEHNHAAGFSNYAEA